MYCVLHDSYIENMLQSEYTEEGDGIGGYTSYNHWAVAGVFCQQDPIIASCLYASLWFVMGVSHQEKEFASADVAAWI